MNGTYSVLADVYNVKVTIFQNEVDVAIYSNPLSRGYFRCDDYGVIPEPSDGDRMYNPFEGRWMNIRDFKDDASSREESLRSSLSRTRSIVNRLGRANSWEFFITFTFDPQKVDRYSWDAVSSKMSNWLNNTRKKAPDLRYLVVPEMHKDGAFHFHGLFSCCDGLGLVDSGVIRDGSKVYNVSSFRLGFTDAERVKQSDRAASYVMKYITKDLVSVSKGKKRYWASRNLIRPEEVFLSVSGKALTRLKYNCLAQSKYSGSSSGPYQEVERFTLDMPDDLDALFSDIGYPYPYIDLLPALPKCFKEDKAS